MVQQTIPLVIMLAAILAGILFNNRTAQDMKAELKADFQRETDGINRRLDGIQGDLQREVGAINGRLDSVQGDLREFFRLHGRHEARLDAVEKRLD